MSDLDNILSDGPIEDIEPVEEIPEQPEEPVASPEPEAQASEPEPEAKPEPGVPASLFAEQRRENRDLRQRLEALEHRQQPAPQSPEFIDPEGAQYLSGRMQEAVTQSTLRISRFMAEREFGKDLVDQAFAFFDENKAQSHALLDHPSPFHAAVEEFRKHQVATQIGNDPAAYEAQLEAKIRAKIESENVVKDAQSASAPSLAGQTNLGSRNTGSAWSGPTPLDDILAG